MPSREQMLAELGAGLQSPLAAFVGALNGLLYMFAGALEALKTQREGAIIPRRTPDQHAPGYTWNTSGEELQWLTRP